MNVKFLEENAFLSKEKDFSDTLLSASLELSTIIILLKLMLYNLHSNIVFQKGLISIFSLCYTDMNLIYRSQRGASPCGTTG